MKKIIALSAIALALLACNKEIAEKQIATPSEGLMTISATTEDLSKVVLDMNAEVNLTWADTDVITVYDGSAANPFTIKSNSGASAVFEGTCDTAASMLYAVYPAAAYAEPAADAIKVVVPATQTIPDGGCVDADALVAVGYAAPGQPMVFKQVCALLKLTVTGSDIMEIVIRGKGLAGTAAVNADGTINASGASLTDEITLHTAAGMFVPGDYFVAVAPGTTPAGAFSINYNTVSATASKTASSEVCFERAKGLDAGPLTGFSKTVVITTMAELFNWNASRSTADIEDVKIGADIDMEGEPWTPKDFTGTFDGQGHKLYNLNVNRPSNACFFNTVNGTVKDVIFGSSNGTSYDGSSAIVQDNPEDDGASWRYAGVVTRLSEGSVLENVKNYAPVTVAATSLSKTRVGGLVGVVAGAATIKNCANNGTVSNLAVNAAAAGTLGGIVGRADAAVTITDTDNNGDVLAIGESVTHAAGILASDAGSSVLTGCKNTGSIVFSSTGTNVLANSIGGIVGESVGTSVTRCTNSGAINNTYNGESKIGGIIGRVNGENPVSVVECENAATGTIIYNPEGASKRAFIGGIVGNSPGGFTGAITIKDCINRAPITGENEQIAAIGGIVGFLNGKGVVTIKSCSNFGEMNNANGAAKNGTSAAEAFIAGIAGYLSTSLAAGSSIDGCVNRGAVKTVNRNIKSMGGIVSIFQTSNAVVLKDCDNYGAVTKNVLARPTCAADYNDNTWYHSIAGIAGKVNLGEGSSIESCINHSGANVWVNTAGGGAQVRMAGITGYVVKCPKIASCSNEADITYDNNATGGSYIAIGGVSGHVYATPVFDACSNSGAIISNRTQVNRIGGVIGSVNNTAVTNCKNTGSVTLNCEVQTANWQSVGGIAGFAEGSGDTALDFSGNINHGAVVAKMNTTNDRVAVGGIVGMPYTAFNVVNNRNEGSVYGVNSVSNGACYVGGILGQEKESGNVSAISGNKNYGSVENATVGSTKAFAGGLFGTFGLATSADGYSYGPVKGSSAGAVAGVNATTIAATICDAVTVNGVTKAAASDEGAWLCPSNTGTITPTYVAHSSSE